MKAILGTMTFGDQVNQDDAGTMLQTFFAQGHTEFDSAYVYNGGKTETLLGELNAQLQLNKYPVATKVNPSAGSLNTESINQQFTTSLQRMKVDSVDLLYLHQPDLNVPIPESLAALHAHYRDGKFKRFGLSNYAAWQVAQIYEICQREGYMLPVVYQGMYNAITRDVERELFKCLENYNIAFYVYNPLAGGMLSGKHTTHDQKPPSGRFDGNEQYLNRYWKTQYFDAINGIVDACKSADIKPAAAALRWLKHHSALSNDKGDGIILGASSQKHLEQNLEALNQGPLPDEVISALENGWEIARPNCIKYFRP